MKHANYRDVSPVLLYLHVHYVMQLAIIMHLDRFAVIVIILSTILLNQVLNVNIVQYLDVLPAPH